MFENNHPRNENNTETEAQKYKRVHDVVHHAVQSAPGFLMALKLSESRESFYEYLKNNPLIYFDNGVKDFEHGINTSDEEIMQYFGDIKDVYDKSLLEVVNNHNLTDDEIRELLKYPSSVLSERERNLKE